MLFSVGQTQYKGQDFTMATGASCLLYGKTILRVCLLALSINHVWISFEQLGRFS
jgi:hypothetical protein